MGRTVSDVREDEQIEKTSERVTDLRHPRPVARIDRQRIPHGLLAVGSTRHELCEQRLDFEKVVGTRTPDPHVISFRFLVSSVNLPFEKKLGLPVYCGRFPVVGHRVLALGAVC
jgi:hypothetical protein